MPFKYRRKMKTTSGSESFSYAQEPKEKLMRFKFRFEADQAAKELHKAGYGDFIPNEEKDHTYTLKPRPLGSRMQRWMDQPVSKDARMEE